MRSLHVAKKELKLMRKLVEEFLLDYEYAQAEEDMGPKVHQYYAGKVAEAYWKLKDLESRVKALVN
ncbi:MAG: hypothetical protein HYZ16_08270 [Bacteroidetes bacterium]|nr:hypothetical protein [Bacteroidota bacterium]